MAIVNLTRTKELAQKKSTCFFTAELDFEDNVPISADVYQLFTLPPNAMVLGASMFVVTPSDAATSATADVGFDGGDTLIDGANLKSVADTNLSGGTNAVVPQIAQTGGIVTFVPTYTGAATTGKWRVVIEYLEFEKNNGEYTRFVNG